MRSPSPRRASRLGALLVVGGLALLAGRLAAVARALPSEGRVERLARVAPGSATRCAVIGYRTSEGLQGEQTTSLCGAPPPVETGARVPVWFDTATGELLVAAPRARWGVPVALVVGGLLLVAWGVRARVRAAWRAWRLLRRGRTVSGRVLRVEEVGGAVVLVVEWTDEATGLTHLGRSQPLAARPAGTVVTVRVDPRDPTEILVEVARGP